MSSNTSEDEEYYRAAIVTSKHPGKPLEGTVVSISTSFEFPIPDPLFNKIIETANEKFGIDEYANDLLLGTLYFDVSQGDIVGVRWEESPCAYSHGDFDDPVEEIPENINSIN